MKKVNTYVTSVFILFFIWLIVYRLINQPMLMPSPSDVFKAFFSLITSLASLKLMGYTLFRLLIAIAFSILLGMVFGILGSKYKTLSHLFSPYVTILRTIPVISIVIIVLIVFGFVMTPYIITFLMIFPIIYQAIHDAIKGIDPSYVDVYKLEDDHILSQIRFCYFPLIKPQITTALLQSAGLGIKVLVMAEYLSQTPQSIGRQIYLERIYLNYDFVFAWTCLLIGLALGIEALVYRYQNRISNDH